MQNDFNELFAAYDRVTINLTNASQALAATSEGFEAAMQGFYKTLQESKTARQAHDAAIREVFEINRKTMELYRRMRDMP